MTDEPKVDASASTDAKKDDEVADPIFEALWARVLEAWDDEKTHAALLDHALREQRLPDAAGRYRTLKDDPAKGPLATKKLGAIVLAATQLLFAMKTPPRARVPLPVTITAAVFCVVTLLWLARQLFLVRQ